MTKKGHKKVWWLKHLLVKVGKFTQILKYSEKMGNLK